MFLDIIWPSSTLTTSIKFGSVFATNSKSLLANIKLALYLSAPGAKKLNVPVAGSSNVWSVSESITVSVTLKPIILFCTFAYFSTIWV